MCACHESFSYCNTKSNKSFISFKMILVFVFLHLNNLAVGELNGPEIINGFNCFCICFVFLFRIYSCLLLEILK